LFRSIAVLGAAPLPVLQGRPPRVCAQALPQTGTWTMTRWNERQRLRLRVPVTPRITAAHTLPFSGSPARIGSDAPPITRPNHRPRHYRTAAQPRAPRQTAITSLRGTWKIHRARLAAGWRQHREQTAKRSNGTGWWSDLGVSPDASMEEIRRSYLSKIKEFHPDRVAWLAPELLEAAERRAKTLNAAYTEAMRQRRGGARLRREAHPDCPPLLHASALTSPAVPRGIRVLALAYKAVASTRLWSLPPRLSKGCHHLSHGVACSRRCTSPPLGFRSPPIRSVAASSPGAGSGTVWPAICCGSSARSSRCSVV
jgi:DnaJ domain